MKKTKNKILLKLIISSLFTISFLNISNNSIKAMETGNKSYYSQQKIDTKINNYELESSFDIFSYYNCQNKTLEKLTNDIVSYFSKKQLREKEIINISSRVLDSYNRFGNIKDNSKKIGELFLKESEFLSKYCEILIILNEKLELFNDQQNELIYLIKNIFNLITEITNENYTWNYSDLYNIKSSLDYINSTIDKNQKFLSESEFFNLSLTILSSTLEYKKDKKEINEDDCKEMFYDISTLMNFILKKVYPV